MPDIIAIMEASMHNDVERMRAISHNLANVTTTGFKREIVVQRPFLDQLGASSLATRTSELTSMMSPRLTSYTDHRSGSLRPTQNPLDLALEEHAFFSVKGQEGILYSRQGNLMLDSQGRLVTTAGLPVLGHNGEIRLTTPHPRIDAEGNIFEGDRIVASLQLVRFTSPEALISLGHGLYRAVDDRPPEAASQPPRVRQGYLEASNVASAEEMIRLIETVRHFESSQRVLKGYDGMLDKSINIIGEF